MLTEHRKCEVLVSRFSSLSLRRHYYFSIYFFSLIFKNELLPFNFSRTTCIQNEAELQRHLQTFGKVIGELQAELEIASGCMELRVTEMYEPVREFTYTVQTINRNSFKGTAHHWMFLQHLVKAVHAERVQTTICICTDTGCPPSTSQQTDLCVWEEQTKGGQKGKIRVRKPVR